MKYFLFHTTLIISKLAFYQCFFISRKLAESKSFTTFAIAKEILPDRTAQGAIAQLVEQRTENPCVPGSIPGGTTIDLVISQNPLKWLNFNGFSFILQYANSGRKHRLSCNSWGFDSGQSHPQNLIQFYTGMNEILFSITDLHKYNMNF